MKEIKDLPKVDNVELPKLGNIRPGVYILALIILALAIIIFLIGILPGIKKGGRFVNFTSDINGVGVFVDDIFATGVPGQEFIESGEHIISYTKGDIVLYKETIEIDHPILFTWFFKRVKNVEFDTYNLKSEQLDKLRAFDLQLIIDQSRITEFNSVNNYMPYALSYAKDAKAFNISLDKIIIDLDTISSFISSIEMLDDVNMAYQYLNIPLSDNFTLAQSLFSENKDKIVGEDSLIVNQSIKIENNISILAFDNVIIESVKIPSTSFVMGKKTPFSYPEVSEAGKDVYVDEFNISRAPVSQYLYSLFVNENPKWSKDNIDNLISDGLVDRNYLKGIALSTIYPSYSPITNISYYAAEAFSNWLTTRSNKTVIIPNEEQWSLAAFSSNDFKNNNYATSLTSLDTDKTSPILMLGGVWEFTSSIFSPYSRLLNESSILENIKRMNIDADIIVKGGSILNKNTSINSVGVMEKDATFDYLGFRIAWN